MRSPGAQSEREVAAYRADVFRYVRRVHLLCRAQEGRKGQEGSKKEAGWCEPGLACEQSRNATKNQLLESHMQYVFFQKNSNERICRSFPIFQLLSLHPLPEVQHYPHVTHLLLNAYCWFCPTTTMATYATRHTTGKNLHATAVIHGRPLCTSNKHESTKRRASSENKNNHGRWSVSVLSLVAA